MSKTQDEGPQSEKFQKANEPPEDEAPQHGKPMGWKQGMGLFNRQKKVEALTADVGNTVLLLYQILTTDPNLQSWPRRLNERRDDFEELRKRLAVQ